MGLQLAYQESEHQSWSTATILWFCLRWCIIRLEKINIRKTTIDLFKSFLCVKCWTFLLLWLMLVFYPMEVLPWVPHASNNLFHSNQVWGTLKTCSELRLIVKIFWNFLLGGANCLFSLWSNTKQVSSRRPMAKRTMGTMTTWQLNKVPLEIKTALLLKATVAQ